MCNNLQFFALQIVHNQGSTIFAYDAKYSSQRARKEKILAVLQGKGPLLIMIIIWLYSRKYASSNFFFFFKWENTTMVFLYFWIKNSVAILAMFLYKILSTLIVIWYISS